MPPRGVYPRAIYRPVPQAAYALGITPTCVIGHSNAGTGGDLYGWWTNPAAGGLYSHFQVTISGTVYQYCPIFQRAPANVGANGYAVSIETANTPGFGALPAFHRDLWRNPQYLALVELVDWICATAGIPRIRCTDGRTGIGGHGWFSAWTTPGHQCPGNARSSQIVTDIIPALTAPSPSPPEADMNSDQDRRLKAIERYTRTAADQAPKAALHAAGANRRSEIILSWESHGGIGAGITKIYQDVLGREPDPGGMRAWSDAATKATYPEIRARISATSEAKARA